MKVMCGSECVEVMCGGEFVKVNECVEVLLSECVCASCIDDVKVGNENDTQCHTHLLVRQEAL